jgi:hypothetical protein
VKNDRGLECFGMCTGIFSLDNSLTQSEGWLTGGRGGAGTVASQGGGPVRIQKQAVEFQNLCGMFIYL